MSDLKVLTWQKVIAGPEWFMLKSKPELFERYLKDDARQHIAAEIAEKRLARSTVSDPDPNSDDPINRSNAVLRLTVAVASRDEAATLASELAEAEDRGFQRAIKAMQAGLETVAPRLGGTAYANAALSKLMSNVASAWAHRPAADWRPMRTLPVGGEPVEYWFITGDIGRSPRLCVPVRSTEPFKADTNPGTITAEEFTAIAWRYAGRPPHRVAA